MRNFIALFVFAIGLVAYSAPAAADGAWVSSAGAATGTVPCSFQDFRVCWWDVTEAGSVDVTTLLDTAQCENVSVSWVASLTTLLHNNTATIYNNHSTTINATDWFSEIVENAVLTGDPATNLFAIYGFDASYIYARFDMNDSSTIGRLRVHCHPRH